MGRDAPRPPRMPRCQKGRFFVAPLYQCTKPTYDPNYAGGPDWTPAEIREQVDRFYERKRQDGNGLRLVNNHFDHHSWGTGEEVGTVREMWVDGDDRLMVLGYINPLLQIGQKWIRALEDGVTSVGVSHETPATLVTDADGKTDYRKHDIRGIAITDTPDLETYVENFDTDRHRALSKLVVNVVRQATANNGDGPEAPRATPYVADHLVDEFKDKLPPSEAAKASAAQDSAANNDAQRESMGGTPQAGDVEPSSNKELGAGAPTQGDQTADPGEKSVAQPAISDSQGGTSVPSTESNLTSEKGEMDQTGESRNPDAMQTQQGQSQGGGNGNGNGQSHHAPNTGGGHEQGQGQGGANRPQDPQPNQGHVDGQNAQQGGSEEKTQPSANANANGAGQGQQSAPEPSSPSQPHQPQGQSSNQQHPNQPPAPPPPQSPYWGGPMYPMMYGGGGMPNWNAPPSPYFNQGMYPPQQSHQPQHGGYPPNQGGYYGANGNSQPTPPQHQQGGFHGAGPNAGAPAPQAPQQGGNGAPENKLANMQDIQQAIANMKKDADMSRKLSTEEGRNEHAESVRGDINNNILQDLKSIRNVLYDAFINDGNSHEQALSMINDVEHENPETQRSILSVARGNMPSSHRFQNSRFQNNAKRPNPYDGQQNYNHNGAGAPPPAKRSRQDAPGNDRWNQRVDSGNHGFSGHQTQGQQQNQQPKISGSRMLYEGRDAWAVQDPRLDEWVGNETKFYSKNLGKNVDSLYSPQEKKYLENAMSDPYIGQMISFFDSNNAFKGMKPTWKDTGTVEDNTMVEFA